MKSQAGGRSFGARAVLMAMSLLWASGIHAQAQRTFVNLGFEEPVFGGQCTGQIPSQFVPGWDTTHPDGDGPAASATCPGRPVGDNGPLIEIWAGGALSVPSRVGDQHAELNASAPSRIYQTVCLVQNEQINWRFSHRGRNSDTTADVANFEIAPTPTTGLVQIAQVATTNNGGGAGVQACIPGGNCTRLPAVTNGWRDYTGSFSWGGSSGSYTVGFRSVSAAGGATLGNFIDDIQLVLRPFVELTDSTHATWEGQTSGRPAIRVSGTVPAGGMTVTVDVMGGTAALGVDYTTPDGTGVVTVTVAQGEYHEEIFELPLTTVADTVIEDNETVVLRIRPSAANYSIASLTGCGLPANAETTWTIVDNDVDLRTSKTVSTPTITWGVPFQYTVVFENNTARPTLGPLDAHDAMAPVEDLVPAGLSFTSWTCQASGGGSCPGGAVNGSTAGSGAISGNANLPAGLAAAGGRVTYTIQAVADITTTCQSRTNTSSITTPGQLQEGVSVQAGFVSPASGGAGNNTDSVVIGIACPDIELTKTVVDANGNGLAEPGEVLTYAITLINRRGVPATGYGVTDALNSHTAFQSASNGGTHAGGVVVWENLTVPPQVGANPGTLTLTLNVTANPLIPMGVTRIENMAHITGTVNADCVQTPTFASCATIPVDSENDQHAILTDLDDDNDGIPDALECPIGLAELTAAIIVRGGLNYADAGFDPAGFLFVRPSDFGLTFSGSPQIIPAPITRDFSALYGLATGSIVVTVHHANVHPTSDTFFTEANVGRGFTEVVVSGTVGSYLQFEHGQEYFPGQRRTVQILDGGTMANGLVIDLGSQSTGGNWTWGSDVIPGGISYWLENSTGGTFVNNVVLSYAAISQQYEKRLRFSTNDTEETHFSTFFVRLFPECDTDGDGIPNRLDLDSDNDGCLDVLEGNGTFLKTLFPAQGTVTSGTGSTAGDLNLGIIVDANGIPVVAAGGQGIGSSQIAGRTMFNAGAPNGGVPADTTVTVGDNATFTAAAISQSTLVYGPGHVPDYAAGTASTPLYRWEVSTDGGATWVTVPGATSATLNLPAVTLGMSGNQYKVIASCAENPCGVEATATLTVVPTAADVTVVKTVADANGNGVAEPGEQLTYTITLSNAGGSPATGYAVTDAMDPLTTFVSASNGGTHAAGVVTWAGLTVPAGGQLALTLVVAVNDLLPPNTTQIANVAYPTGGLVPDCSASPLPAGCAVIPVIAGGSCPRVPIITNTGSPGELQSWHPDTGALLSSVPLLQPTYGYGDIAMNADGTVLYGVHFDFDLPDVRTVDRIDPLTGLVIDSFEITGAMATDDVSGVNGLSMLEDGRLLAGSTLTRRIYLIDPATGDSVEFGASFPVDYTSAGDFVTAPDGDILAVGATSDPITFEISTSIFRIRPDMSVIHVGTVENVYGAAISGGRVYLIGALGDLLRVESLPIVESFDPLPVTLIAATGQFFYGATSIQETRSSCLPVNFTLAKQWSGAIVGDSVSVEARIEGDLIDSFESVATSPDLLDLDPTPISVFGGDVLSLSETFLVGDEAGYTSTLACTGNTNPLVGNELVIHNDDIDVVCTFTNLNNQSPLVEISKSVADGSGNGIAEPGEQLTYTITLTNSGGGNATGFGLTDVLDANTTFVSADNGGAHAAGTVTWTGLTVPANGNLILTVVVNVVDPLPAGTALITNLAYETGTTPPDCSATPTPAGCATIPTAPAVTLAKTVADASGNGQAEPGEQLTYTITLTNSGGSDATPFDVTDVLDANTTFVSADNGGAHAAGTVTWTGLTVPANGNLILTVVVNVVDPLPAGTALITNLAYETGTTPPDCSATPTPAGCATIPTAPAVTLAKTVADASGNGQAEPGEQLTYTITLSNSGGSDATPFDVTDVLDANTTFVSADNGGAHAAGTVTWTNLTVPANGTLVLTVVVNVVDPLPEGTALITNLAHETGTTPPDCSATPTPAGCATIPTAPAVTLAKTVADASGNGQAEPGEQLTYTITLTNSGGSDATPFDVTDVLDGNTTFVSADNGGAHAGGTVTWTNLTVPANGTLVLTVVVNVVDPLPEGTSLITNLVHETGTTPPDCSATPEPAGCATIPTAPAVTLSKTVADASGNGQAEPGEQLTYTITLSNSGGSDATPFDVTDMLDGNTTFVSADNGGAHAAGVVTWTNLTVPANGTLVLTVIVNVVDPLPAGTALITNLAHETGTTPPDCSATPTPAGCATIPTAPAVTLAKTVADASGNGQAEPGEQLTYTITLTNSGGSDATPFDVTDMLDGNTTFVSADNGGSHVGGTITWTNLTVPANGNLVLTVVVNVIDPLPAGTALITNLVHETGTTPPDCSATPTPAGCATIPTAPAVTLAKTVADASGNGQAEPGEQLTYTITLTNSGGSDATPFDVTDVLDANTTFVSADNGGTHAAGTVTWTGLTVPANGTLVLTVVVNVVDPLPAGTALITNLVHETGTTPPDCSVTPTPAGCATIPTAPAVTLAKTVSDASGNGQAEPGEQLTYTITLSNSGGSDATPFAVTDMLDGNTTFVSADNGGTHAMGTVTWTNLTVPANGTLVLTIVVSVVDPLPAGTSVITNLAHETGTTPPDCSATPTPAGCATIPTAPAVTLAKTVADASGNGQAEPGEQLTYTITLTNSGGSDATPFDVTDVLDGNTTFVSASNGGTHAAGTITWTNLTVPANGTLVLTVVVNVVDPLPAGTALITNLAHETGTTPPDCSATPTPAGCATIPTAPAVTLAKTVADASGNGQAEPGEQLTYTITLSNSGGSDATPFDVTDVLDANTVFVSADNGGAHAGGTVTWTNLTVPANGTLVLTVVVNVVDPLPAGTALITNLAHETGGTPPDCSATPTPAGCATIPTAPAVTLAKTVADASGNGQAEPGEQLTYTITLTNSGGSDATPFDVTDVLDANTTFVSADNGGGHAAGVVTWTNLTVPANGTLVLTVIVNVIDPLPAGTALITNLAHETGTTPPDCSATPTPAGCATIPTAPAVTLAKTVTDASGNGQAEPGEQLTYTITLTNSGGSDATPFDVTDVLDGNTTFVSADNGGAHAGGTVTWTNLTVPANGNLVLTVVVNVIDPLPAGTALITNLVHETGTTPPDCSATPTPAGCATIPTAPAVTLAKTVADASGNGQAEPGEQLTYTITLTNSGGSDATPFDVTDVLDANTTFVSADNGGTHAAGTVTWTGLTVPANGTLVLTVVVNVVDPLPAGTSLITNLVHETGTTPPDCSVTPTPAGCATIPTAPAVTLAKTVADASGNGQAEPGEQLTYTITLSNSGGSDATPFDVTDVLDGNTTFVSADNGGAHAAGTVTWTNLTVPANGTLVLTVVVNVVDPLPEGTALITNLAHETGTTPPDCSATPTPAGCATIPTAPAVTLAKTVADASGNGQAEPGEQLTYTITLSNSGGSDATPFDVTDMLDGNTTFVSADNGGTHAAGTITWTNLTVPANGNLVLTVVVTVIDPLPAGTALITNLAYETGTTPPDCSASPQPAGCATIPTAPAVTLAKTVSDASGNGQAEPGEQLTYTITLTNSGGSDATPFDVTDVLDANTTFVSADNGGTYAAGAVTWTGLTVPANGTLVLTVIVTVVDPLPAGTALITNLAHETGTTPPDCSATPEPAGCATIPTAPAVTLAKTVADASGNGQAEPGEQLTYTITLTNSGGSDATPFAVTDVLDGNTTFVSADNGGAHATGTVTWTNLTVPANGTLVLTVIVNVIDPLPAGTALITNLAHETGTTPPDCSATPTPAGCATIPTTPAVTLAKTVVDASGNGQAEPGEQLTYTITLTNSGGSDATPFGVTDVLDGNTTFVSADNGGTHAAGTVTWTGLTVPANGTLVLTVVVTVIDPLPAGVTLITNLAYETGTTPPDCSATPTPAGCATIPTTPAVTLAKTVVDASGNGQAEPGEQLTYTITLTNSGGSDATPFNVTDVLDSNTTFVSANNGGTHAAGTVTWTGLTVPANGNLVLTVIVTVIDPLPEGVTRITNLVHESGTTPPDCSATPQPANCATIPTTPALTVTKALSGESMTPDGIAEPGEQLTWTITVRNEGGTATVNTIVNEIVPDHTRFVGGTPTWSCAPDAPAGTACETLLDVPASSGPGNPGVATVTFTVVVDDPLPAGVTAIANAVAIEDGTPPDCSLTPTDPGCSVIPTINLNLRKSVVSLTATGPGSWNVTYLIEIDNTGGSVAQYTLTDTLQYPLSGVVFTGLARVTTVGGVVNPAFGGGWFAPANGIAMQLSGSNVSLSAGGSHDYLVTVAVGVVPADLQAGVCTGEPGNGLYNEAAITGPISLETSACQSIGSDIPLIRLVKTVALGLDANGDNYGDVGDVLDYSFVISNPGTVPLSAVQLIDPRVSDLQCDPFTANGQPFYVLRGDELFYSQFEVYPRGGALAPGDSIQCWATHTLTLQDVQRRRVVNTATTSGTGPGGQTVSSTSTAIYTAFR